MWAASPRVGDWVVLTEDVTTGMFGGRVARGTKGVVLADRGGWFTPRLQVRLDVPLAPVDAVVATSALRVTRRSGGEESFRRRSELANAARWGALVAMMAPLAFFIGQYWWYERTFTGLLPALATGLVASALDLVEFAVAHPTRAVLFAVGSWLIGKFTFRS
jgi:hypothetical protein